RSPRFGGRVDISGNVPERTQRLTVTRDRPVIRDISLKLHPLLGVIGIMTISYLSSSIDANRVSNINNIISSVIR
ncbi:hypothetical protein BER19_21675, partial [Escherichia coli]